MSTFIVVVEDDHLQETALADQIRHAFPGVRIDSVGTEHEFRAHLDGYRDDRPDLFVMDVMLRWTRARRGAPPPPPDVESGGYLRAGIRCADLVARDPMLAEIPIVYYTILERSDLERGTDRPAGRNTTYVRKSTDPESLIKRIRDLIRNGRR